MENAEAQTSWSTTCNHNHQATFDAMSAPFVIRGALKQWPSKNWTVDTLAKVLGEKTFRCRLMPQERVKKGSPAWEAEGVYIECQLAQFSAWCRGEAMRDNPLAPFSPLSFSGYIDYKYMKDVFAELPHMLKEVPWSSLGLTGVDGTQSTIWIGSAGASTPCHYDTYGFNLVAQIQGRKLWVLFPPEDSDNMYPTRVPYEESSVFSQLDLACPNLLKFPRFKNTEPIVITLEPGQVLYVPRHWWHYVTCSQTAVSINTWVEMPEDKASQLQESVTRLLASSLIPYLSQTQDTSTEDNWINPTEDIEPAVFNVQYMKAALKKLPGAGFPSTSTSDAVTSLKHQCQGRALFHSDLEDVSKQPEEQKLSGNARMLSSSADAFPKQKGKIRPDSEHLKTIPVHELEEKLTDHSMASQELSKCISVCESIDTKNEFQRTSVMSTSLGQVAQTLQGSTAHSVESPFTLSELLEERQSTGISHIQSCHCDNENDFESESRQTVTNKRIFTECDHSEIPSDKMVLLNKTEFQSTDDSITHSQESCQQIKKRKIEEEYNTTGSSKFLSEGRNQTLHNCIEKSSCDRKLEAQQMSVYIPKRCSLQQYLTFIKKVDGMNVFNSWITEDEKDSAYKSAAETSDGVQHDLCVEEAVLKSVLHPDVIKLIVTKLQEQIACDQKN